MLLFRISGGDPVHEIVAPVHEIRRCSFTLDQEMLVFKSSEGISVQVNRRCFCSVQ